MSGKGGKNMPGWADYVITGVRYCTVREHIDLVSGHDCATASPGTAFMHNRATVLSNLERDITYCTARRVDGDYVRGADVIPMKLGGITYIKTEENDTEADNLGELPEF